MEANIRKLKIYRKFTGTYELIHGRYGDEKFVPQLKMAGAWLERAGFKIGSRIIITVNRHRLIIDVGRRKK